MMMMIFIILNNKSQAGKNWSCTSLNLGLDTSEGLVQACQISTKYTSPMQCLLMVSTRRLWEHICNAHYSQYMFLHIYQLKCFMFKVLPSTFNDENYNSVNLGPGDSYIKHSVAPRCIRPSTAPNRLEVEVTPASSDVYHSALGASEPARPQQDLHTNAKPVLKRKVLR